MADSARARLRLEGPLFPVVVADPDGLLGRDVLEHLRFTYDGPRGVFSLKAGG